MMKDVIICDKLWLGDSNLWFIDVWMRKLNTFNKVLLNNLLFKSNLGKWNISVPRGKENECDFRSSGERNGNSPNHIYYGVIGLFIQSKKISL